MRDARCEMRGFTIIETLVAVSILMLIIAGTFTGAQSGLQSSIIARDQVIAFYLAQEVFEHIKNERDTAIMGGDTTYNEWVVNITNKCSGDGGGALCVLDTYEDQLNDISNCLVPDVTPDTPSNDPTHCPFLRKGLNKQYGHDLSWQESNFRRFFNVTQASGEDEIKVDVTILWRSSRVNRELKITSYIYNWRP